MLLTKDTTNTRPYMQVDCATQQRAESRNVISVFRPVSREEFAQAFVLSVQNPKTGKVSVSSTKHCCLQVSELPTLSASSRPGLLILSIQLKMQMLESHFKTRGMKLF